MHAISAILAILILAMALTAGAQTPQVVDVPSRPGVTQRILVITPDKPRAAVILFAGGDGGIGINPDGSIARGGNFLVRSRQLFADQGVTTAVIDTPSDRPNLADSRQTNEHVADVKAVIAWLRQQAPIPIWLVGTSRGTLSATYIATQLPVAAGGPDGLVLTATMLTDRNSTAVPEMELNRLRIPVLVAHHKNDACRYCLISGMPRLMDRLTTPPRKELMVFEGGNDVGDPCQARSYHGFNGIERDVVQRIAAWITAS